MSTPQLDPRVFAVLRTNLGTAEGVKPFVYDDATDKAIVKGSVVQGNPTIGIGRNLASKGLAGVEVEFLFRNDANSLSTDILGALPWVAGLSVNRQAALMELYFNTSEGNLQRFLRTWPNFIDQLQSAQYADAATNLRTSQPWATEVGPNRSGRMADMILNG